MIQWSEQKQTIIGDPCWIGDAPHARVRINNRARVGAAYEVCVDMVRGRWEIHFEGRSDTLEFAKMSADEAYGRMLLAMKELAE